MQPSIGDDGRSMAAIVFAISYLLIAGIGTLFVAFEPNRQDKPREVFHVFNNNKKINLAV
jgi:hypothetical protein